MDIWYSQSRNAREWSDPHQITYDPKPDWASSIHADSTGTVRIVWSSSHIGNRELFMAISKDGGGRWSPEHQITHSQEEDDFPHLIEMPGKQWLLAWTRYRKGSKQLAYTKDASAELVIARSQDGESWTPAEVCSPPDPKQRFLDLLPFLFTDREGQRLYLSWTSSRSGKRGDILVRDFEGEASGYVQLTTIDKSDYDAKILPAKTPGRYLMVWVSNRDGKTDIYSRTFSLPYRPLYITPTWVLPYSGLCTKTRRMEWLLDRGRS